MMTKNISSIGSSWISSLKHHRCPFHTLLGILSGPKSQGIPGGLAWWPLTLSLIVTSNINWKVRVQTVDLVKTTEQKYTLFKRFTCFYLCFLAVGSKPGILYHVQYFGDAPERGYIFERNIVSFMGEHQYQDLSLRNKQQLPPRTLHKNVKAHIYWFPENPTQHHSRHWQSVL